MAGNGVNPGGDVPVTKLTALHEAGHQPKR